jgi:Skp family chaperone for outer membrane proteins
MKKILFTALLFTLCASASFSQKFSIGGVHRGGTSPVNKQKLADRFKSEFKLTDDQANTLVTIQQDYQLKSRAIKIDTKTTNKEKKEKLQPIEEERNEKLKKFLTEEQINKVDEVTKEVNMTRGQRQAKAVS